MVTAELHHLLSADDVILLVSSGCDLQFSPVWVRIGTYKPETIVLSQERLERHPSRSGMRPCPEYLGVSFTSEEKNGAACDADSVVVKKVVSLKAKIPIYGRSKVVTSCVTEPREQDCGYKHLFYGSFHHSEDYRVTVTGLKFIQVPKETVCSLKRQYAHPCLNMIIDQPDLLDTLFKCTDHNLCTNVHVCWCVNVQRLWSRDESMTCVIYFGG